MQDKEFLSESELADRWGVSPNTVRGWRSKGIGPQWVSLMPQLIRYRLQDVIDYENLNLKQPKRKNHE